jgi:hypothetical protein
MVENLAREYQGELAAAGTFVALEELTATIGDEFGRQLCENELLNRAKRALEPYKVRNAPRRFTGLSPNVDANCRRRLLTPILWPKCRNRGESASGDASHSEELIGPIAF